jgi:hypothetical protein
MNNEIGFQSVFCFLMVPFLGANHKPMMNELLGIKKNCHYGRGD